MSRQRDRLIDKQAYRWTVSQTGGWADRKTKRQMSLQTNRQINKQAYGCTVRQKYKEADEATKRQSD
jgi:hypothetical protein